MKTDRELLELAEKYGVAVRFDEYPCEKIGRVIKTPNRFATWHAITRAAAQVQVSKESK